MGICSCNMSPKQNSITKKNLEEISAKINTTKSLSLLKQNETENDI